ncbi:MAG TPA: VOC family protein [Thermoplasmata archaeon]|nr:VOC family protein [Thermoplasmata archaeon]
MAFRGLKWDYTGLRVQNLARSIRFYEKVGYRVVSRGKMEHGGRMVDLKFTGSAHGLELNYYPPGNPYFEPIVAGTEFDHFGFVVGDIEGWVRLLRRKKLPIVADWTERGWRLVFTRDPDGNWFEVGGRVRSRPRRPS